jgi:hypothetical protein
VWLAIFDSGDVMHPERLEHLVMQAEHDDAEGLHNATNWTAIRGMLSFKILFRIEFKGKWHLKPH